MDKEWWRRLGYVTLGAGTALILEHAINYGYLDSYDFIGHEWLGLLLILVSFIMLRPKRGKP